MTLLDRLHGQVPRMLEALGALVGAESPSNDPAAILFCADVLSGIGTDLLGAAPSRIVEDGGVHLRWRFGEPRVLLVGHFDTVWPLGTTSRWGFRVDGDRATGPGIFDMKAGLVQGLFAVAALDDLDGIEFICNSDEEIGSLKSRPHIEESARRVSAALILEPSEQGAVKTARKGVAAHVLEVQGRAAHSGLEPQKGVNAMVELAHQVLRIAQLGNPNEGTTVTPTLGAAGTTTNTVPAHASVHIDIRARSMKEFDRVHAALHSLSPVLPGAKLRVTSREPRPPLPASASAGLFRIAQDVAVELGMQELRGVEVGGGSDGNLTAGVGTPTLDGLGAVGAGAHAEGEHILVSAMAERAALLSGLIDRIRSGGRKRR